MSTEARLHFEWQRFEEGRSPTKSFLLALDLLASGAVLGEDERVQMSARGERPKKSPDISRGSKDQRSLIDQLAGGAAVTVGGFTSELSDARRAIISVMR